MEEKQENESEMGRMIKIKNCPFCGEKAKTLNIKNFWIIGCDTLDTSTQDTKMCFGNIGHAIGFETEEEAIKAWNTRK